ncbi:MAG TPA: bifunctional DNA-formamidopyrimidine glycosylase/DNA-(apurinic or apyrimidinic site) lyase [Fibrobacteria bacterium]|nr:bifunctional DNA-formamidopyrimidine glycosylase/DNA-(apurinic or apyrimidinic site) lyase [Fibrobacteria bacterium]
MPELPEVETVRRGLERRAAGEIVVGWNIFHPGILEDCRPGDLAALGPARLERFDRVGKYLLVRMSCGAGERTLVVHLGMSGQFTFRGAGEGTVEGWVRLASGYRKSLGPHPVDVHTHAVLDCGSGGQFLYRDPRRFGRLLLVSGWGFSGHPRLDRLGPDALSLDADALSRVFADRFGSRSVKAVLLDQSVVAGVGNIYADESCFEAGIRPSARSALLPGRARHRLAECVLDALERGIRNSGTTFRDFVGADGASGTNAEDLRVYGRAGLPCLRCGTRLVAGVVAARGTVHCPKCQR